MKRDSFVSDTAKKTGKAPRTIREDVQIAGSIPTDVQDAISELPKQPGKTKLLNLSRKLPDEQRAEVERMKAEAGKPRG